MALPSRGEVWWVNLSPTEGHEQSGSRPLLVLSHDALNHGPAELLIGVPITSNQRQLPTRVRIDPPEGGLSETSFAMCDQIRTISRGRLRDTDPAGNVEQSTLASVTKIVARLLGIPTKA